MFDRMFRCAACKGLLVDAAAKRCDACGTSLRRNPPVSPAERTTSKPSLFEVKRSQERAAAAAKELRAQQGKPRRRRREALREVSASVPEPVIDVVAEAAPHVVLPRRARIEGAEAADRGREEAAPDTADELGSHTEAVWAALANRANERPAA
jgi:hypothetical protein